MSDITTADAEAYRVMRLKAKAKPSMINRELGIVKQMFSLAKAGLLMAAPHIDLPKEKNARQGFLEYEQYRDVLRHLPEDL